MLNHFFFKIIILALVLLKQILKNEHIRALPLFLSLSRTHTTYTYTCAYPRTTHTSYRENIKSCKDHWHRQFVVTPFLIFAIFT